MIINGRVRKLRDMHAQTRVVRKINNMHACMTLRAYYIMLYKLHAHGTNRHADRERELHDRTGVRADVVAVRCGFRLRCKRREAS